MHPHKQRWIFGRIPGVRGKVAFRARELSMHTVVYGPDPFRGRFRLAVAAERQREHRAQCSVEAMQASPALAAEAAVIGYPLGDERVSELKEDGASPAG